MFRKFRRKEMNRMAAESFWQWFMEHEQWIIENIDKNAQSVVWAIDEQFVPIFPYMSGEEIEFQFGFNGGKGEFFFFHLDDKALIRDGEILKTMMPDSLRKRWTFILEE